MKKLLIISILIFSVIFISGCISDEKTDNETSSDEKTDNETSPDSQINQNLDTQSVDLIIKSKDVPGLTLSQNYHFFAVPENTLFVSDDNEIDRKRYTNTLPIGYRNVGEESTWRDQSGREVTVVLMKYDSNSGLVELFSNETEIIDKRLKENSKDAIENGVKLDSGESNIGDCSYYFTSTDTNTDIEHTCIFFINKNKGVTVMVIDEEDKSFNEAMRIAKLVKSRLD